MKRLTVLLGALFVMPFAINSYAKKEKSIPIKEVKQGVFISNYTEGATEYPMYPGGMKALNSYFNKTSFVPNHVSHQFNDGLELALSFDIQHDGSLGNIDVVAISRPKLDDADKEVIKRVKKSIENLNNWTPATINQIPTSARLSMLLVVNKKVTDYRYNAGLSFINSFPPSAGLR